MKSIIIEWDTHHLDYFLAFTQKYNKLFRLTFLQSGFWGILS